MAAESKNNNSQEGHVQGFVKKFPQKSPKTMALYIVAALLVVSAGVGTGWYLADAGGEGRRTLSNGADVAPGAQESKTEAGVTDESVFSDTAEGTLKAGGVNGEGTHHLVRDGGESQNVYLTSTVIDLENFVGKKVQVWGQTIAAQKAGWLMDVGKVKVVK